MSDLSSLMAGVGKVSGGSGGKGGVSGGGAPGTPDQPWNPAARLAGGAPNVSLPQQHLSLDDMLKLYDSRKARAPSATDGASAAAGPVGMGGVGKGGASG